MQPTEPELGPEGPKGLGERIAGHLGQTSSGEEAMGVE